MSKAILEFNLADQDDKHEFTLAMKASDMHQALYNFNEYMHNFEKYGADPNTGAKLSEQSPEQLLTLVRDTFIDELEFYNIDLY